MEECESSRTNGGVGGECRGEHEILEREILLEPSLDRRDAEDAENESWDRCGRCGLTKKVLRELVAAMEVGGSSLSLRSDTFLPEASSPNIVADSARALPSQLLSRGSRPTFGISTARRQ